MIGAANAASLYNQMNAALQNQQMLGQMQHGLQQGLSGCGGGGGGASTYYGIGGGGTSLASTGLVKEIKVKDEILPDISLTRVFKWAIVLVVGMALGKRVWSMFGEKITNNLNKALEHVSNG